MYTDGAAEPNPGAGGYAAVLIYGKHRREISGGFELSTNNRMEMMAVIAGLEALKEPCRVTVHSDSKYIVDALVQKWAFRWRNRDWWRTTKDRVANRDLWARLLIAYEKHEVVMTWVKGHAGIAENERCDVLAVAAVKSPKLLEDSGFKQPKEDRLL